MLTRAQFCSVIASWMNLHGHNKLNGTLTFTQILIRKFRSLKPKGERYRKFLIAISNTADSIDIIL